MSNPFKVGDPVEVVSGEPEFIGRTGVIYSICPKSSYNCFIVHTETNGEDLGTLVYKDEELALSEPTSGPVVYEVMAGLTTEGLYKTEQAARDFATGLRLSSGAAVVLAREIRS